MEEFILNAREKGQTEKPDVMMRNVRQFMSGMKNFLFNRQVPEVDAVMDKVFALGYCIPIKNVVWFLANQ